MSFDTTTVMIGENGCGKSSLLKAIEICLGRGAPEGSFALNSRDFHRPPSGEEPQKYLEIELRFRQFDTDNRPSKLRQPCLCDRNGRLDFQLQVRAERNDDAKKPTVEFQILGPSGSCPDPLVTLKELRRLLPFLPVRNVLSRPKPGVGLSPEQRARDEVEWYVRAALSEMADAEQFPEEILAFVHQALEGLAEQLQGRAARLPREERSLILAPLSPSGSWEQLAVLLKGSGARSLAILAFVGAFLRARGEQMLEDDVHPLVAIEEPEATLHPLMVTSVWDVLYRLPAQKLVTTNSADLLAATPIDSLRRLSRHPSGRVDVFGVASNGMSLDDLRRVAYHLRVRRGTALFMRFWILVEGETEFWLLAEAARALGVDLRQEGIECLEFAQSGLAPIAILANHLGIGWHILVDGDKAGQHYRQQALTLAEAGLGKVTMLKERDIEHCLWQHGYDAVYRQAAGVSGRSRRDKPHDVITRAIRQLSKPRLALLMGEEMRSPGSPGVPEPLETVLRDALRRTRANGP